MNKKKECKGNYRVDYFGGCGALVYRYRFGLCNKCYAKFLLSDSALAKKEMDKLTIKSKKENQKNRRIEIKKKKEDLQNITYWKNELQKVVNKIVRLIDGDLPCISHPKMKGFLRWDAGHFYTVKTHSDIRFNVHNIHKQNSQANQFHGGNADYVKGVLDRYGNDYLKMMLDLPLKYKGVGKNLFTISNIRTIYLPNARKLLREIENGGLYTRDEINKIIGIYT